MVTIGFVYQMSSPVNDVNATSSDVELVVTCDSPAHHSFTADNVSVNATSFPCIVVDEADKCLWSRFVVNTLVIGALCVFGLFGNTLSLLVLQRDRHNRVAVFLLQSLATADNLVLCAAFTELSVVYGLLPVVGRQDIQRASEPYLVKYVNPVGCTVQSCAIWIIVLLAVNRYVAICRPFSADQWLTVRRTRLQVYGANLYITLDQDITISN